MTISTGDILKVVATLVWTDANVAQNVYAAVVTGAGGPWDEADIVADALDWMETLYATLVDEINQHIDGSQIQVYLWDTVGLDWDEIGSTAWVFAPTNVTDQMPRGVAALLNAKSTDPDSSGKKYIPGFAEGDATDGLWNAPALAALVDYGAIYVGDFVGSDSLADWDPGVWSVKDEVLNPFSLTVVIPTVPAYQRRRKRGVGI